MPTLPAAGVIATSGNDLVGTATVLDNDNAPKVTINDVTVTAAGSGAITDSPVNTGNVVGTVTYTIIPTVGPCSGTAVNYVVTVNPIPDASAAPQAICSGQSSSVAISNPNGVSGTTFSWVVFASSNGCHALMADWSSLSDSGRDEAVRAARRIGFPVVTKPYNGNHGRGISIRLTTDEEVALGFAVARGHAAIRESLAAFLAMRGTFRMTPPKVVMLVTRIGRSRDTSVSISNVSRASSDAPRPSRARRRAKRRSRW